MCLWSNLSRIPLGISLGVVLLDHMADLCLAKLTFKAFITPGKTDISISYMALVYLFYLLLLQVILYIIQK
jgi:hypothetical protein